MVSVDWRLSVVDWGLLVLVSLGGGVKVVKSVHVVSMAAVVLVVLLGKGGVVVLGTVEDPIAEEEVAPLVGTAVDELEFVNGPGVRDVLDEEPVPVPLE